MAGTAALDELTPYIDIEDFFAAGSGLRLDVQDSSVYGLVDRKHQCIVPLK